MARFRIAGFRIEVLFPEAALTSSLSAAWRAFVTEEPPDLRIEVDTSAGPRPPGEWSMMLPEPRLLPDGGLRLQREDFDAQVSPDRTVARVRGYAERYPLESLVKVLLAERLLQQGGLLVHGVAVARGDRAALFTGHSGAGKSTLGTFAVKGGLSLLGDELVAVSPDGAGYRCEGTPWNVGAPREARLILMGELAWAAEARIEPADPTAVLRLLLPNSVMPDATPAGRARMFQAASALLRAVPSVRLRFARDPGVGPVLASALEAA